LLRAMWHETRVCFRRAAARRGRLLLFAALLGAGVGFRIFRVGVPVEGWVALRVVESRIREGERPSSTRELRKYLFEAVFTRQALAEALKADPRWRARIDRLTPERIDEIREDIRVDIQGNTFNEERGPSDPPRSVRLRLGWRSTDAAEAQGFAEMLVRLLTQAQAQRMRDEDARARVVAETAVAEAKKLVDRLLAQKRVLEGVPNASAISLAALDRELRAAQEILSDAQSAAVRVGISHRAESEEPWHFSVVDRPAVSPSTPVKLRAIVFAILTSVGCYPVLLLLMGAFSWRLSEAQDAEKLGFALLGCIPGHSVLTEEGRDQATQPAPKETPATEATGKA